MNVNFEINRKTTTTTWLTPPDILARLGEFDLDPCAAINQPWPTAKHHFTENDDGLLSDWFGRVWLNPPYGRQMPAFLQKMAMHGNGIALTFCRTETKQFARFVWPRAHALLFKTGKIYFLDIAGRRVGNGPGAGSVFIAYGAENAEILKNSGIGGGYVRLR